MKKEILLTKISNHEDEIENFLKNEKRMSEEVKSLTIDKDDLKITNDQISGQNEKLEAENQSLESDKSDLEDRVEELFREVSDLILKGTQEETQEALENSLNKIKTLEKKLCKEQQNIKEASDSILMLENTLENKLSEIELFRKKVEEFEEANSNSCEKCENPNKTKYGSEMHDLEQDSLPSTSKCGTCAYVSDDENDMKTHESEQHVDEMHVFSCELCEFKSIHTNDMKAEKHITRLIYYYVFHF